MSAPPARIRVALEPVHHAAAFALAAQGFEISDAQEPVERARAIKLQMNWTASA